MVNRRGYLREGGHTALLVAFLDSIERFLYAGTTSGTSTDLLSFVSSGLIDLRRGEACYRIVRDANVISYSITGA